MASHGYAAWGIDEAVHQLVPFTSDKALAVQAGEMKTHMSNFLFTARDDDLVQRLASICPISFAQLSHWPTEFCDIIKLVLSRNCAVSLAAHDA